MKSYLLRKILFLIPMLIGVSFFVYVAIDFVPGDPVQIMLGIEATEELRAQLRAQYGLDEPLFVRYTLWLFHLVKGDMGVSMTTGIPVIEELSRRVGVTLQLTLLSILFSLLLAIPTGIIAAAKQNTFIDFITRIGVLSGISLPGFAVGILLILFVSRVLGWIPPVGFVNLWDNFFLSLQILLLPVISLGLYLSASVSRMTRSSMLEVLRQDYIRTAHAKGLHSMRVIYRHALQNAMIPVLTLVGMQIGYLFGGAVIIEEVFSLPGVGRLLLTGIYRRDYPVVMACVLLMAFVFALMNTLVDVLYGFLDPRIKYQ